MEYIRQLGNQIVTESGKEILLRGFGLGGWLLPEGYMWKLYTKCDRPRRMEALIETLCGKVYAKEFWKRYYETYITEKDIIQIKREKFNSVRLPINARKLYHIDENGMQLNLEGVQYIDKCVGWCKKHEVYMILDMHGAPGGQTGTNIDDSEKDLPELFIEARYQEELIKLWTLLASRYEGEACIAAYDLLNEPLPKWFSQYNHFVLPLYRRITEAIRQVDQKHMIILEGVHWATDFEIFEEIIEKPFDENWMLQFHKYWSTPDKESIASYIELSKKLNVPLFMGEGGENNLEWYTAFFKMLEDQKISYSFWSYKKMEAINSPISFRQPRGWDSLIQYIDGEATLSKDEAHKIFDAFLFEIAHISTNEAVFRVLKRQVPLDIMAEYFDAYHVVASHTSPVAFRGSTGVDIQFQNGKIGEPDYKRYGGEAQPEEEKLCIQLHTGEWLRYDFYVEQLEDLVIFVQVKALKEQGRLIMTVDDVDFHPCQVEQVYSTIRVEVGNKAQGKHFIKAIAQEDVMITALSIIIK